MFGAARAKEEKIIMKAIVYTSNTGHTEAYAKILGEKIGLPVYSLSEAGNKLPKGADIIYLGWLFASRVKGYKKATKKYKISAICGVGLCDNGTLTDEVRKTNSIPEKTPIFTVQGGIDKTKLRGINKFMINTLIKGLSSQKERSVADERMLYLLTQNENYVCEENLDAFLEWYNKQEK